MKWDLASLPYRIQEHQDLMADIKLVFTSSGTIIDLADFQYTVGRARARHEGLVAMPHIHQMSQWHRMGYLDELGLGENEAR